MTIQLIEGVFSGDDALDLLSKIIDTKVKFHETKITQTANEEDIKYRETKIKQLQKLAVEIRSRLETNQSFVDLHATINIH